MSFTARTVVRRMAHRGIDWSSPHFRSNPELASAISAFRAWASTAEAMADKYSSAPAAIDFAAHKSAVRDKSIIEDLEAFYASAKPAPEVYEWSSEDKADKERQMEDAKGRLAFTQEMIADTETELEFMKANRTTRDTSGTDIMESYPDIAEETEKELEERRWFKDAIA